ncbi:MAG: hypothetical protein C4539_18545 [Ignavibacteriales bacterium]|nr:MAG: hypothetical protein C4539_18545 [Ignavibacteriales bacterium]
MKFKVFSLLMFLMVVLNNNLLCQADTNRIVIMPFINRSIDNVTIRSAEAILKQELSKLTQCEVLIGSKPNGVANDSLCENIDCIVKYGESQNAGKVLTCNFLMLGQKIIIQYSLVDVIHKKIKISDSMNSATLEELDVIMKRIALSTMKNESADASAVVGAITESETKERARRSGGNFYGISFGYFFPGNEFYDTERTFTLDFKFGSELENVDYGIQLFARNGFGVNVFSSYLFSQKDVCPYIGGGAGFHWLTDMSDNRYNYSVGGYTNDNRKEDGFELVINSGIRFFHTYNFRITVNFTYAHTFNDYDCNSYVLTVGFLR